MTDPGREPTGDYGYDEAHADMAGGRAGSRPADARRERTPSGGTPDGDDDYGYDEAHGF